MDNNTYVYCTDCVNYKYTNDYCMMENCCNQENNYCKDCPCEGCNCLDTEDSRPFSERPNYIKMEEYKNER